MSRSGRRHARRASATTAAELFGSDDFTTMLKLTPSSSASTSEIAATLGAPLPAPIVGSMRRRQSTPDLTRSVVGNEVLLEGGKVKLAPLFSNIDDRKRQCSANHPSFDTPDNTNDCLQEYDQQPHSPSLSPQIDPQPNKSILKESRKDSLEASKWSLWLGSRRWFGGVGSIIHSSIPESSEAGRTSADPDDIASIMNYTLRPYSSDLDDASRNTTEGLKSTPDTTAALQSRTAPSFDFERSTYSIPPLSQERIKSTEFWSNFAQELDPSKLKRIRFSMPLIVTEFDPDDNHTEDQSQHSSAVTTLETMDITKCKSTIPDYEQDNLYSDDGIDNGRKFSSESDRIYGPDDSTTSDFLNSTVCSDTTSPPRKRHIQWNLEALSNRQYRVQEVWELYERTCKSLDIDPLPSFEEILWKHMRNEQALGSLDLSGTQLIGVHMKCFADILDLNFGLVKLELSHCDMDDNATRLLVYSLLCNDSVRYLSLANNNKLRSDGIRYISILVRHSKRLQLLDISGISIRKKSAGYLAAALAGLGDNWSIGKGSMSKTNTKYERISLQALRMNNCGINPAALSILASGVRLSPLQHLSLRLNSLNHSAGPILREMLYGDPPQSSSPMRAALPRRPISVSLHGLSDAQISCDPSLTSDSAIFDTPRVSHLRSLDLSQNDLGRAMLDLAEGLLWNKNLRNLVIRQNKLHSNVLASFSECLGLNKGLEYLDISRNPICGPSIEALEVLAQVLPQNNTLKGLFISTTGMTSEGAITLAECLPELTSLERLDVSDNPGIDIAGLMALSASIKLNKSLICFEITVNTSDEDCASLEQAIAQACIANMQRMESTTNMQNSSDFNYEMASAHVWPHKDPKSKDTLPGVVASDGDAGVIIDEHTSLVTDIAAVKRTPAQHIQDIFGNTFDEVPASHQLNNSDNNNNTNNNGNNTNTNSTDLNGDHTDNCEENVNTILCIDTDNTKANCDECN